MFARFSSRAIITTGVSVSSATILVRCSSEDASQPKKDVKSNRVVIVGGGTAGVGVAAMLRNEGIKDVTIVEPKDVHYYQPLWTLVGGGVKENTESSRPMSDVLPSGTTLIKKHVKSFDPANNQIGLEDGSKLDYDYLVVAAGMQIDWHKVPGLVEGLKTEGSGVASIYDYEHSAKTWREVQAAAEKPKSRMLFTFSPTPIKCAGAPQKIMWLVEDTLRAMGKREGATIEYWTPGGAMFGVKHYADKLAALLPERGVTATFKKELIDIDVAAKVATFKTSGGSAEDGVTKEAYDVLHVAPHMSAPDFIQTSPLADEKGWVAVDKTTLQSTKFANVFGIGDCTSTPNSKTAAAITSQAPVLVHNMGKAMEGKALDGVYKGYSSCPLVISRNKVLLAEFGYGGKLMESFAWDTGKFPMCLLGVDGGFQHQCFYQLKEKIFPFAYWNMWTKGNWYGTNGPFKPDVTK